jgi:phenylalanyl-tRNA synthetase beta chain
MDQVFGFIMDADEILDHLSKPIIYKAPSIYPKIKRDLNFVLNSYIDAGEIIDHIKKMNFSVIKTVLPINIYEDVSLGENKKSILFQLVFQDYTKTLEDKHVNPIINEIIDSVEKLFKAKLRQ